MNLMAGSFAHMANLLFPRGCAGCDKPDDVLCDACLASFDCELSQPLETAEMGRWFACGWYRGAARQSILAWKDHGDEECDRPFSDALCRLAERAGVIDAMDGVREICDTILVVPASSSIASMRQRGRRHMMPLAKRLSAFLRCRTGFRVQVCDALTNKGIKGKSVETKGTEQRAQRLKGHVMVRPGVTLQNKAVILVDDIVTSGATMRRCVDALTSQGVELPQPTNVAAAQATRAPKNNFFISLFIF